MRGFLHKAGVYFLATEDGDQPQVRPFGTAEIKEGKLYIQTGHVKNVAKQIAANPGLRSMYDENDDNTAVYFLKDAKATINSFTAAPVEVDF